jgi:hypothetical protein
MILFSLFFSSGRKMKWGLGQSPKQVDNQSVVMNFEKILGDEVKVNLGQETSHFFPCLNKISFSLLVRLS